MEKVQKILEKIEEYLNICNYKNKGLNLIFEGACVPLTVIERLKANPENKIIFLGKPSLTPQEFFDEIRKTPEYKGKKIRVEKSGGRYFVICGKEIKVM